MTRRVPWSDIGRLQSQVSDINHKLMRKTNNMEFDGFKHRVLRLEEIAEELDSRLGELEERINRLETKTGYYE